MHKVIRIIEHELWHITSEPGDRTRYDYFVYRGSGGYFHFMPRDNTFKYQQKLSINSAHAISALPNVELTEAKPEISPYTMLECVRTVIELTS